MIQKFGPFAPFDSNMYLLTGDVNVLIDTGSGFYRDALLDSVEKLLDGKRLEKILLTHCHYDHVGGVEVLVSKYGCEVYAGKIDAESIRAADSTYTLDTEFRMKLHPMPVKDLSDGDIIDIGAHKLRVIDTPGHTRGGVSFYDEVTSSLFSGDTLFAGGIGRTNFPGGSPEALLESINKFVDLEIKMLYPGHGLLTKDGAEAVKIGLNLASNGE